MTCLHCGRSEPTRLYVLEDPAPARVEITRCGREVRRVELPATAGLVAHLCGWCSSQWSSLDLVKRIRSGKLARVRERGPRWHRCPCGRRVMGAVCEACRAANLHRDATREKLQQEADAVVTQCGSCRRATGGETEEQGS